MVLIGKIVGQAQTKHVNFAALLCKDPNKRPHPKDPTMISLLITTSIHNNSFRCSKNNNNTQLYEKNGYKTIFESFRAVFMFYTLQ